MSKIKKAYYLAPPEFKDVNGFTISSVLQDK
jgi:hypothetical protein